MDESAPEDSDAALVRRMARGDRAALSGLYSRHAARLLALAVHILKDRGEAEDLVHDVFLEAWQKAATYSAERGAVGAWLSLRARSRAIDRRRSVPRTRAVSLEALGADGPIDPSADPTRTQDQRRLGQAFAVMSADEQQVIVLGYFEGLTSSEIAEQLGTPIGTVKSDAKRAREAPRCARRSDRGRTIMTDPKPPEFVGDVLADEPGLEEPIERLPELLDPLAVSPGALERLMSAVAEPPLRYAPFFERLSALWDLPEAEVRALLERSRNAKAWRRAPLPGLELINVTGGPRIADTHAYLARFAPGMTFPSHRHRGREDVLLLEGSYRDSSGAVFHSGDVHTMSGDTEHTFTILPDEPCIAAAVHHGIRFSSLLMRLLAKLSGD